jgi:hypothetical protein
LLIRGRTLRKQSLWSITRRRQQTAANTCTTSPISDPADVTVAELKKGVRILVTDAYGDNLQGPPSCSICSQ